MKRQAILISLAGVVLLLLIGCTNPVDGGGSIDVDFQNPEDIEVLISGVPSEIAQRDGFTASTSGYDSYSWYLNGSVSNTALSPNGAQVTVDTGSLSLGTHTLSVFAQTGSNTYSGQVGFTVTEPTVASLDGVRLILGAGLASSALSNADAPGATWTTSNPAVATVDDNGMVTAVSQGTASITVDDPGFGSLGSAPVVVARAFYELDGNGADATGNGHDATNNSASTAADRNGHESAAFDVSSGNLSIADGEIGLGSAFSVAFWMRWDEVPSAYNSMVDKDYSASGFSVGLDSGGSGDVDYPSELANVTRTMRMYLSDSPLYFSNGYDFKAGTPDWVHVIITFSDADDESKLYVDGSLSEAVEDTRSNTDNSAGILIGNAALGDNFKGVIDDLVFFNKALSDTEAAYMAGF